MLDGIHGNVYWIIQEKILENHWKLYRSQERILKISNVKHEGNAEKIFVSTTAEIFGGIPGWIHESNNVSISEGIPAEISGRISEKIPGHISAWMFNDFPKVIFGWLFGRFLEAISVQFS